MPLSSVGHFLINSHIPKKYQIPLGASSSELYTHLERWAKEDPTSYADNIVKVKRAADEITRREGFTIGLDDIQPLTQYKNILIRKYEPAINNATSIEEKKKLLDKAIRDGADMAMKAKGSLPQMVSMGIRGNKNQLMKNIVSPIAARDTDGSSYPFLIKNGYSEGLSPSEYWAASIEARNSTVEGKTAVAEPGDFGKQMFNALNNMVVSTNDCGTTNGIPMSVDDHNILDRYTAQDSIVSKKGTLVTDKLVMQAKRAKLKELIVRSPMTCEARNGVCQLCYGLNVSGSLHNIGNNVGTIAAQSLTEPLTQMKLSVKHGGTIAGKGHEETGIIGVRKMLTKPALFPAKAALAQVDGVVDKVIPAPQGGHYIYVNGVEHYSGPNNEVLVKKNSKVIKGDSLSGGLKDPREFTQLRGIGSGRAYLLNSLYNAYNPLDKESNKRVGMPIDKRHLEVLVKKDLNHVVINDHNDTFTRGDIVEYNKLKSYLADSVKEVPLREALGEYLGKEYFYYTIGTEITPQVAYYLASRGVTKVIVTQRKINFSPLVTNLRQIPLLKNNFMAKLTHHEIKNTLRNAGARGEKSEISGYDPIPSFIRGIEFGEGADGKY